MRDTPPSVGGVERDGAALPRRSSGPGRVPASGNLGIWGQRFWLGPSLGGVTIRLWIDTTVVQILRDDVRLKTLPSRLTPANLWQLLAEGGRPAGPPPLATDAAGPCEVDRLVNACGSVGLAGRQRPVGYHLAGRRVTVRFDGAVMQILDDDRMLLRALANPLTSQDRSRLRDARPAGPAPNVPDAFHVYDDERLLVEASRTAAKPVARFKARKPDLPRRTNDPQRCV
jgi:hypothetical protein